MGKVNMSLLKGVEEQENVIDESKSKSRPQSQKDTKTNSIQAQSATNISEESKNEFKTNVKPQKQSFSFRAEKQKIETWKLYADTIGTDDIGELWSVAIDEYISNHKLSADQQIVYDLKKQALEAQKKINSK